MADELSRCLRERRRQAGRTLRDIADVTGYSVQHISEIERGTRYAPDPSIMRQWVERLGGPDQDAVVDLARRGELMRSEAGRETLAERDALAARVAALVAAGDALVAHYTAMVESGDCGFWDAEQDEPVIAWRAAVEGPAGVPGEGAADGE